MMDIFKGRKHRVDTVYNGLDQMADKPVFFERISDAITPIQGKVYYVPCIVRDSYFRDQYRAKDEQEEWMDLDHRVPHPGQIHPIVEYVPVIDHPHSDLENGQKEVHYHTDDRFRGFVKQTHLPQTYVQGFNYQQADGSIRPDNSTIRPEVKGKYRLEYLPLECTGRKIFSVTPVELIRKSTLAHKCIHKGKCPHRGYDLSKTPHDNGVITCPLHGLQFDAFSKKLLVDPSEWKDLDYFEANKRKKEGKKS